MATEKVKYFAGFWPRVGAWLIDAILLGVVGCAIGWAAMDYVSPLGANGRFIGLAIGVLYHGILGSSVGGGRTIGKRLLGLKVVDLKGRPLNLFAALVRALFLVGPGILNGWYFFTEDPLLVQILMVVTVTAVFGIGLAQVYLIVFGWPARRLIHDLVSGSVVVYAETRDFPPPKGRVHAIVATIWVIAAMGLALAAPTMLKTWMPSMETVTTPEQRVVDAVQALPEVGEASAEDNTGIFYSDGQTTTTRTLIVTARTSTWPADPDPLMAKIGAATVHAYKFAPEQRLTVKIVHGFDLGIASYSTSKSAPYNTQCTTADVKCLEPH